MGIKVKYKIILKKNRKNKYQLKIKDETKPIKVWSSLSDAEKLSMICQLF
ncbi:hypothetical protein [Psychrilyobacter atlanticus]|nr:hypothetical protein [Psychrilyobacter atlanticus]